MARGEISDEFDQFMRLAVTMSAANTLTFGHLAVGMSIFDYAAFVISRVEYDVSAAVISELVANADQVEFAITGSDTITSLATTQPEVYDYASLRVAVSGAAATAQVLTGPLIHDYSNMKGGGLLVPAQDMYIGMTSAGFAAARSMTARVYFRTIPLKAEQFIEIAQRLRVLST